MRKVTLGVANSLDNFIARKDGSCDWLFYGEEVADVTQEYWKTIDTLLIGRKTYEVMLANGQTSYPGVKNYVFSRTMKESPDKDVEIVSENAAVFVKRLKSQPGKGICLFGGGELAKSLFVENLIDEVVLNIHPVLLGSGILLFHEMNRQIDLELIDCRTFKNGCVLVSYRVKN